MIFQLLVLALVGGIAFVHFTWGFFSALISAIAATFACLLAFGYGGYILPFTGGAFAEGITSVVLVCSFAVLYVGIRTAFDKAVPGNIRLPLYVDKAGAIVFGLLVGMIGTGTLAIAGYMLPFGTSIGWFERFTTRDTESDAPALRSGGILRDALITTQFDGLAPGGQNLPARNGLWLPADQFVVWLVNNASRGALSGSVPFDQVHPDLLAELQLQNGGTMANVGRSATNFAKVVAASVPADGLWAVKTLPQVPAMPAVARKGAKEVAGLEAKPDAEAPPGKRYLVVRVKFDRAATSEPDNVVRFSPGLARFVAGGKNYFPVGTLEGGGKVLAVSLPDDPLFSESGGVDLVYLVDEKDAFGGAPGGAEAKIAPGAFVELKRLARVTDLEGKPVKVDQLPTDGLDLIRHKDTRRAIQEKLGLPVTSGT